MSATMYENVRNLSDEDLTRELAFADGFDDPDPEATRWRRLLHSEEVHRREQRRYDEIRDVLLDRGADGRYITRARLTFPNGYQRSGRVEASHIGDELLPRLDGRLLMGEVVPVVRIEAMQPNGRYLTVWEAPR